MTAWLLLTVALAGGCGAVLRYLLDFAVMSRARGVLPWGTGIVNVTGALALGFLTGLAVSLELPASLVVPISAGFLGAYTTFSTWMYETLRLIEEGAWGFAAANALGSLVTGVAAALLGLVLGTSV